MFIEDVLAKGVVIDDVWDLDKLNNSAKESVGFTSQKRENLLERIIKASCPEGGIVLDYHLGSGTTAAAAHKLNRRYIGIEQMDYITEIIVPRLQNVINGEQQGISKDVGWTGGGSFVYCELSDQASSFSDKIESADTVEKLFVVWQELKESSNLSFKVDPILFDNQIESFKALPLEEQKQLLIEMIDKNQLYVNLSDIQDESNNISAKNIEMNNQFYGA